ncbi:hypothetical protein CAEBREN_03395 [Caenorhabditis brenneri]|uniref:Uncharacterized protein n=1 Tax=Caenorhabditis brenneri TaxID=135651 RepID=G0MEM8_CAEBE|nr:hypothetical protein CAEBREN_03395 [Caenorhabditis brenneri]
MEFASHPPIVVYPPNKGSITLGPRADLVKVYLEGNRVQMTGQQQMKHISGHIIAVSRGGNYNISIPYRADVFRGDLVSIGNDLSIQEDLRPPHQRIIRVENQLPFDVAIYNISMAPELVPHFSVRLIDRTALIHAGHTSPVFVLKYNKKLPSSFDNATIFIHTNVSTFNLSLSTYTGKMNVEMTSVDKNSFDFGFVEKNDTRTIRFIVWNHNRAEMRLKNLVVPDRSAYRMYEVGVKTMGNFSDIRNDERLEYVETTDVDIPPMKGKIFDLELKVPYWGEIREGNIVFETDYESKVFAVTYQVSTGSLQAIPDEISFGQTFPSRIVYRKLQIFNSFDEDMTVTRLTTLNEDPRFFFEGFDPKNPPVLRSGRLTNLGRIMFSPAAPCEHEYCYLGIPLGSSDGAWFTHGLSLPSNLPEIDSYLYKQLRKKYDALVKSGKHHINTTIILDTDKAKNIMIKTSAELVWPRLLTRSSVHFPLTALHNFTIVNLTLSNPTSIPIAVQVIPLVIYPDAESLVELMRPHLKSELTAHVEMNETLMFSLRDTELFTLKSDSPVPKLREAFEYHLNHEMQRYNNEINIPRFTLSMILKPHMNVRLRLGFLPSDYTLRSSLLLIRNNLTAIEPVVVYGKGARIGVKVEGSEARSKKPLLFEIRHDHLTDCNNPKRLMHKLHSTLTVRRPFLVMNTGEVQFLVTNMSINGVPCENRGFRILNCYPFRLQPNETYALDIAAWLFPLAATVPGDMLAKCHQALPRPPFENIMYYSCVTALIFCLVCVLACAYLEGDRAIACAIRQQFAIPRHVFDLNNLRATPSTPSSTPAAAASTTPAPTEAATTPASPSRTTTRPSALRASSDAWWIKKVVYNMMNFVIKCVHWTPKKQEEVKPARTPSRTPIKVPKPPTPAAAASPPQSSYSVPSTSSQTPPTSLNSPDLFYRQFLASMGMPMDAGMWDTPAAQAAMPFMNLWNYGGPLSVEQMEDLIRQASGGVPATNTSNTTTTTPSESDWKNDINLGGDLDSVGGEEQPDWIDEEVNVSDADMDFSAMSAASRRMFQDDEAEELNDQMRRQRSPSQASSTLSKRLENSPQKIGGRRLTIGSEKKKDQYLGSNQEFTRTPGHPNRFQNSTSQASMYSGATSSGSIWGGSTNDQWGVSSTSSIPTSSTTSNLDDDPLSLSHLGINLAENPANLPVFGNTMFSGPEFNLWSSSSLFYQPPPPSQDQQNDENDENKKSK